MGGDAIRVLLVGTGDDFGTELESEGFVVARIPDLAALAPPVAKARPRAGVASGAGAMPMAEDGPCDDRLPLSRC